MLVVGDMKFKAITSYDFTPITLAPVAGCDSRTKAFPYIAGGMCKTAASFGKQFGNIYSKNFLNAPPFYLQSPSWDSDLYKVYHVHIIVFIAALSVVAETGKSE